MKLIYVNILLMALLMSCKSDTGKSSGEFQDTALVLQKEYPKTSNYPEADQFDAKMEKDFVRAANEFQNEIMANEAIITSRNWVVYKDNSGRPIYRNRIAVVTAKIGDRCYLQHLFFQQDAKSVSKYGTTYVSDSYGWKEFDCSLKK